MLEVSLTAEHVTVEMIGDGKHLPPTLMKLAYRSIGADRLCLISDATSGAGLPDGARFRMGEMEYVVGDGVANVAGFHCVCWKYNLTEPDREDRDGPGRCAPG